MHLIALSIYSICGTSLSDEPCTLIPLKKATAVTRIDIVLDHAAQDLPPLEVTPSKSTFCECYDQIYLEYARHSLWEKESWRSYLPSSAGHVNSGFYLLSRWMRRLTTWNIPKTPAPFSIRAVLPNICRASRRKFSLFSSVLSCCSLSANVCRLDLTSWMYSWIGWGVLACLEYRSLQQTTSALVPCESSCSSK